MSDLIDDCAEEARAAPASGPKGNAGKFRKWMATLNNPSRFSDRFLEPEVFFSMCQELVPGLRYMVWSFEMGKQPLDEDDDYYDANFPEGNCTPVQELRIWGGNALRAPPAITGPSPDPTH